MHAQHANDHGLDEELDINESVTGLYKKVKDHYDIIINSISEDDYDVLREELELEQDYEEYIQKLKADLKPSSETIMHLNDFLKKYPEFTKKYYLYILDFANDRLLKSSNTIKRNTTEFIKIQKEQNKPISQITDIPDKLELPLSNSNVELETYSDPLLVALYSMLFMGFTSKMGLNI